MAIIELTQGMRTLVDDEDAPRLLAFGSWQASLSNGHYYAKCGRIYMHRLIVGAPPRLQVDHRNRERLDNRKVNLRVATPSQNGANRTGRAGCTSKYKGVFWQKDVQKWVSHITREGRRTHLGTFTSEIEAARAYDRAALQHHKGFEWVNFPASPPSV